MFLEPVDFSTACGKEGRLGDVRGPNLHASPPSKLSVYLVPGQIGPATVGTIQQQQLQLEDLGMSSIFWRNCRTMRM